MRQPRSAKANPFPYRGSLVCYLSLDAAGSLTQVGHDFSSAAEAYRRAAAGEIRLYAVWPGEYSIPKVPWGYAEKPTPATGR